MLGPPLLKLTMTVADKQRTLKSWVHPLGFSLGGQAVNGKDLFMRGRQKYKKKTIYTYMKKNCDIYLYHCLQCFNVININIFLFTSTVNMNKTDSSWKYFYVMLQPVTFTIIIMIHVFHLFSDYFQNYYNMYIKHYMDIKFYVFGQFSKTYVDCK